MDFKLTILEIFVRLLPEAFLFILAGYAYSRRKIDLKKYFTAVFLFTVIGFCTRFLPIQPKSIYLLNLIALMILFIFINNIDTIKSITSAVIIFIITLITESIMLIIYDKLFNIDMNLIYSDAILRVIYGAPSLLITAIIFLSYYFTLSRLGKLKHVT